MKRPLSLILVGASLTALTATAQINSPSAEGYYARGVAMFQDNNYIGALDQLGQARRLAGRLLSDEELSDIERLTAIAAVRTGRPDGAALVDAWLDRWKASTFRGDVEALKGDLLLAAGDWAGALKVYAAIDDRAVSPAMKDDLIYHRAYANLKLANFEEAVKGFATLKSSRGYGSAAWFYTGYIAYTGGDYPAALDAFDHTDRATMPGMMADYFVSQIEYYNGQYEKALSTARALLSRRDADGPYVAEANRVAGEALYQTGRGDEAIPYLKKYVAAVETPELSALYVLGLAEYGEGRYAEAVRSLTPVTADDSAMGQSAYLYIGQALLKEGDSAAAIMAFNRALTMDIDPAVTETAYYNFAVAKAAGGKVPFASSVTVFEDFLNRYPDSRYADAAGEYIVTGYLTDDNYEAAWASINRINRPNDSLLGAKQKVAYTLGARLLNADRAPEAITYLTEAEKLARYDAATARETGLALGEALLRNGRPSEAIERLQAYIRQAPATEPNRAVAQFDLGYARMAMKDWADAATDFERVIASPGQLTDPTVADAWTRLGDARYYQRQWKGAADAYDKAYSLNRATGDYPLYQKAVMLGYEQKYTDKLAAIEKLMAEYPTSSLVPDALLEMAEAAGLLNRPELAESTYRRLIDDYGETSQGRRASLYLASDQSGAGDTAGAIVTYQELISRAPTSEEAARANEALKRLHADNGTLFAYTQFLESVDQVPALEAGEAERLAWDAAERAILNDRGPALMEQFSKDYPRGIYAPRALAYLMDDAEENGDDDKAYVYASRLVSDWPDNSATEDALVIKAETDYNKGNAAEALAAWQMLDQKASTPDTKNMARMGMMRVARDLGDADRLLNAADAVLSSSAAGSEDKTEAEFSRGLAYSLKGDTSRAFEVWKPLSTMTDDLYGAKAAVYSAENRLAAGQAAEALAIAESFIGSGTPHTYWLGRGFIVLSDALEASDRHFEAVEYLKALKDNYPGDEPDIYEMIEERIR